MMTQHELRICSIHVPVKRMKTLEREKVDQIALSVLEEGQKTPIQVRAAGSRFVLIEGLHRLEAMKALGEEIISGYLVRARLR